MFLKKALLNLMFATEFTHGTPTIELHPVKKVLGNNSCFLYTGVWGARDQLRYILIVSFTKFILTLQIC